MPVILHVNQMEGVENKWRDLILTRSYITCPNQFYEISQLNTVLFSYVTYSDFTSLVKLSWFKISSQIDNT